MPIRPPSPAEPGVPIHAPPKRRKTRHNPTNEQKFRLREWYFDDEFIGNGPHGAKTLKDCGVWWDNKYGWFLPSSNASKYISDSYLYLSDAKAAWRKQSSRQNRVGNWPILEDCLFEWQQRFEVAGGHCTGDILRAKATEFWGLLTEYSGELSVNNILAFL